MFLSPRQGLETHNSLDKNHIASQTMGDPIFIVRVKKKKTFIKELKFIVKVKYLGNRSLANKHCCKIAFC
jgi:hypothetical protein